MMKIKIKRIFGEEETVDLEKHINDLLNGDDYGLGAVESARATADNASKLLGKLIGILTAKKILSDDDLYKLFGRLGENDLSSKGIKILVEEKCLE